MKLAYIIENIFDWLRERGYLKCYRCSVDSYSGEYSEGCVCLKQDGYRDLECGSYFVCYLPMFIKRIAGKITEHKIDRHYEKLHKEYERKASTPHAMEARADTAQGGEG